jgi:hypothetical protein
MQVILDLEKMMQLFSSEDNGMVNRTARFLKARGYQQEFDDLDSSLQGCLGQLSCIINISQLAAKVPPRFTAAAGQEQLPVVSAPAHTILHHMCSSTRLLVPTHTM